MPCAREECKTPVKIASVWRCPRTFNTSERRSMFAFLRKVDHTTSRKTRKGRNFHNKRPGFEPLEGRVVLDAAGSTMGTSLNLGAINGQVTHHDSIGFPDSSSPGGIDTIDWYKFTLTAPCPSLNVRLAGLSANADLQVYRDTNNNHVVNSGELLGSSNNPGTAHDVVNLSSQPADNNYYVRVNRVSGETSYTLTLTADYAGNSRQEARDAGRSSAPGSSGTSSAPATPTTSTGSTSLRPAPSPGPSAAWPPTRTCSCKTPPETSSPARPTAAPPMTRSATSWSAARTISGSSSSAATPTITSR